MTDVIRVRDLRLRTRIGVSDEERASAREVIVDFDLETDTRRAGVSDELEDTIDYHQAVVAVAELVENVETRLLEHLAEKIASRLTALRGAGKVILEIRKESPPIVEAEVGSVSVRIERRAQS
jgi:7,8-dihydroneopterin aldolase/epimerase/oxygenase